MQQGELRGGGVAKQQTTLSFRAWFDMCYRIALLAGILETRRQATLLSQPRHAGGDRQRDIALAPDLLLSSTMR